MTPENDTSHPDGRAWWQHIDASRLQYAESEAPLQHERARLATRWATSRDLAEKNDLAAKIAKLHDRECEAARASRKAPTAGDPTRERLPMHQLALDVLAVSLARRDHGLPQDAHLAALGRGGDGPISAMDLGNLRSAVAMNADIVGKRATRNGKEA